MFIPFQARGILAFELDDDINDPATTTAAFVSATGTIDGVAPAAFLPFEISPIEFVSGSLTNIERDGGGNVVAADVEGLSMKWEMQAAPGGNAIRMYTRDGLPFNSEVDSIPFSVGTILAGPEEFGVFHETGNGENDPLAVIGRSRTLTIVPEPTSNTILGAALGLIAFVGRRHRRVRWMATE